MTVNHEIKAESRQDTGRGASRRLRRADKVPAIIYGGSSVPENIQLYHNDVLLAARSEWFFSSILDISVDGKKQKVLLRDYQKHPVKQQMLHLDFLRIDEKRTLRVQVPLHFVNEDQAPASKLSGVLVNHEMAEVEITCRPSHLPEFIAVDLSGLDKGDVIHLSDLVLPEGVEIPELNLGKEHDHTVVAAKEARVQVEEETTSGDGEPAATEDAAGEEPKED